MTVTEGSGPQLPPDKLFSLIRVALVDVMGSTAFAVLLRRAVARAAPAEPELSEIAVMRDGFAYQYRLPPTWQRIENINAYRALAALLKAMLPLAVEISGRLAARRVVELEPLRTYGLIGPDDIARWRGV